MYNIDACELCHNIIVFLRPLRTLFGYECKIFIYSSYILEGDLVHPVLKLIKFPVKLDE